MHEQNKDVIFVLSFVTVYSILYKEWFNSSQNE